MSQNNPPPPAPGPGYGVPVAPLLADDPPKVGDFWLDARLMASPSGVVFTGHGDDGTPVMLLLLSEGAADDAAARDRLAGAVNKMHIDTVLARGGHGQDQGRMASKYRSEEDDPVGPDDGPLAPWAALAYDGTPAAVDEARRLLDDVALANVSLQGQPSGPDYRLHWIDRVRIGTSRLWPLPWPGRRDRASWVSVLVSWLLMLLLAALAVLLAILIFQNSSSQSPQNPVSQGGSGGSSGSQSAPQSSGSQSQSQSQSPSGSQSQSGSPQESSPGEHRSPTKTPSMHTNDPEGTESAEGGTTPPNTKL